MRGKEPLSCLNICQITAPRVDLQNPLPIQRCTQIGCLFIAESHKQFDLFLFKCTVKLASSLNYFNVQEVFSGLNEKFQMSNKRQKLYITGSSISPPRPLCRNKKATKAQRKIKVNQSPKYNHYNKIFTKSRINIKIPIKFIMHLPQWHRKAMWQGVLSLINLLLYITEACYSTFPCHYFLLPFVSLQYSVLQLSTRFLLYMQPMPHKHVRRPKTRLLGTS